MFLQPAGIWCTANMLGHTHLTLIQRVGVRSIISQNYFWFYVSHNHQVKYTVAQSSLKLKAKNVV